MTYSPEIQTQVKAGRTKFIAMAVTYLLGVFNDNFFKQVAIFLAFAANKSELQAPIIKYFSLPFILFSAYAGFFADKYPKRNVVIVSKYLELAAMSLGALGIILMNFPLIIAMVFLMALQSTLFGPALNGAIPELYPDEHVPKANAAIKTVTTIAILVGIVMAGFVRNLTWYETQVPFGNLAACGVILLIAIIGIISSYGIKKTTVPKRKIPFPWTGPLDSIKGTFNLRKDPKLLFALSGSTFFYFSSTIVLAFLNELCLKTLAFSEETTGLQLAALAIGVAIGAIIAAKLSENKIWQQILPPASFAFGLCLIGLSTIIFVPTSFNAIALFVALLFTGACGGLFLIPVITYIQVHPPADQKGRIIGISNFLDFSGIFLGGTIFGLIIDFTLPVTGLIYTGITAVIISGVFFNLTKKERANV